MLIAEVPQGDQCYLQHQMNHLSWANTANLSYNSDVFTEWLCRITVTKQLLPKS